MPHRIDVHGPMKLEKEIRNTIRLNLLLSIVILVPLGFATKLYSGPADVWVNNSLGGVLYEIFWCLVICFFYPKAAAWKIGLWVFIGTSVLEFMQLLHLKELEVIRSHFLGRTLIGTHFTWLDFPHYIAGCAFGWFWICRVRKEYKA